MPHPRRSDARRNRAAILRAACATLGRGRGLPSAREIARLTGLGLATVYRHFPDRRTLLLALTDEHLTLLRQAADHDLEDLLRAVLYYQATMRGVADELRRCPQADQRHHARALVEALRDPFTRAADRLNKDVTLDDLLTVVAMFQTAVDSVHDPESLNRVARLLIGALFRVPGAVSR